VLERIDLIAVAGADGSPEPPLDLLDRLAASLARILRVSCRAGGEVLDAGHAVSRDRGQYNSSAILHQMRQRPAGEGLKRLAIAEVDLFVPVLTFVFGEAQIGGANAIVSVHRLREEFYGLPGDDAKLDERLAKEALHELGHTLGLRHCLDWRCAMASSHSVERLDLKSAAFCRPCLRILGE
jgi:archaemetzincin